MKKSDIYDGISRINEKYREDSGNFEDIAMEFRRARIRRTEKIVSFAASLAIAVIVGVNIHDKNIINNSSMIKPSDLEEDSHITAEIDYSTENEQNTTLSKSDTDTIANENKPTSTNQEQSSSVISDFYTTDKIISTQTSLYIYESEPVVIIPDPTEKPNAVTEKPVVTIPDTTEKPNTATEKPVATIPDITEKPNTATEKPVVTIPDTTELPIVTKPDEDNKTEDPPEHPPLHWEEMNITQQYFMCTFEDIYYKTMNKAIDSVLIGEYLGIAEMDGYDQYNDRYYHCTAKVYEINGISKTDSVAVLFENETEFFTYTNYKLISKD